jgi:hypothetical protein
MSRAQRNEQERSTMMSSSMLLLWGFVPTPDFDEPGGKEEDDTD